MFKVEALSGKKIPAKAERVVLGSTFEVALFAGVDAESLLATAFHAAHELEKSLNVHDPDSEISKIVDVTGDDTFEISPALGDILTLAEQVADVSEGAFNPWREGSDFGDFTGVAHGFIIDRMVDVLQMARPGVAGYIRVEGLFRFFNVDDRSVILHMEDERKSKVTLTRDAVCLTERDIFVEADDCATAEALATVALFARPGIVDKSAKFFKATVMEMDEQGRPIEELSTVLRHAH